MSDPRDLLDEAMEYVRDAAMAFPDNPVPADLMRRYERWRATDPDVDVVARALWDAQRAQQSIGTVGIEPDTTFDDLLGGLHAGEPLQELRDQAKAVIDVLFPREKSQPAPPCGLLRDGPGTDAACIRPTGHPGAHEYVEGVEAWIAATTPQPERTTEPR